MPTLNSHGLEPQEEAVMNLWDEALSPEEIASRLQLSISRVNCVIRNFSENPTDRWHYPARAATERLGLALAKAMAA